MSSRTDAKAAVKLGEYRSCAARASGSGKRRFVWRPAAAMEMTLTSLRIADESDPANNVVWARAADLVGAPRKHMRLLGLSSRSWPRGDNADPLLPEHVLNEHDLVDLPRLERDRLAFEILDRSPGLERYAIPQQAIGRRRVPRQERVAAASGPASVLFRGPERRSMRSAKGTVCWLVPRMRSTLPRIQSVISCWTDWTRRLETTPHDGGFRKDHPAVRPRIELAAIGYLPAAPAARSLGLCVAACTGNDRPRARRSAAATRSR